jgi:DNA-binding IclR family transcriptional regulator
MQSAYPGTQAVLRAIGLLKAFTAERPQRSLADLARTVDLNKTTAFRLLSALASEGLVERHGEEYRLGPELLALGARAMGAWGLRGAARAEIEALAAETRETATLEVLVGRDTLILDEAMGTHVLRAMPSIGTRWPAHATSTGKTLLAALPPQALDTFFAEPLQQMTPRTIGDAEGLRRELARVRARGYAVSSEELEPGFVAVGAPVLSVTGQVVAALSVGGPRVRLDAARVSELAVLLPEAATRVSERLGYSPQNGAPPRKNRR